jgi:hypothetical protein
VSQNETSRSSFIVNNDTGVYLKYATSPTKAFKECVFTFTESHLAELARLKAHHPRVLIVLVWHMAKEICAITFEESEEHRARRKKAKGEAELRYQLLVTVPQGKSFRVYMSAPRAKEDVAKKSDSRP